MSPEMGRGKEGMKKEPREIGYLPFKVIKKKITLPSKERMEKGGVAIIECCLPLKKGTGDTRLTAQEKKSDPWKSRKSEKANAEQPFLAYLWKKILPWMFGQ